MNERRKRRSQASVSYLMSHVKSKDSDIEVIVLRALKLSDIPFKRHYKIVGTPDFVVMSVKLAIFCDSEFWHGYDWKRRKAEIRVNKAFWINKIETNIARDRNVDRKLRRMGWSVLRFWEYEIKQDISGCLERIIRRIEQRR